MVIILYFQRRNAHSNTRHTVQPPHLLHISIQNATKSVYRYRKIIQKLFVTPCLMKYHKPPSRQGRTCTIFDKREEQSSPRQMDTKILSRRQCLVEKTYKGQTSSYIMSKSTHLLQRVMEVHKKTSKHHHQPNSL